MKKMVFIFLLITVSGFAGVTEVIIRWNADICKDSCIKVLNKYMSKVEGIDEISYDQPGGQAIIKWDPDTRFTYTPLRRAMQMTGIGIDTIWVTMKGKVEKEGDIFYVHSSKEGSRLQLLSPVTPEISKYVPQGTVTTHQLSPSQEELLEGIMKDNEEVTVTGKLFFPDRYGNLKIVVSKLSPG